MIYRNLLARAVFFITLSFFAVSCAAVGIKTSNAGRKVYASKKDPSLNKEAVIRGYVYNSKTRKPVKGASVEIKNANLGVGYYLVKTDSEGFFEIKGFIPHIRYIVEVEAHGYVTYKSRSIISLKTQNIYIDPEAVLEGKVTDSSGMPLRGVEVKLVKGYTYGYSSSYNRKKPEIMKTDSNGKYRFLKLTQSKYIVYFNKPGYISETVRLKYIKRGEVFRLPMQLFRPASITGKITIKGVDVPAINVNITVSGRTSHSASTFHDGSFQITDIKPGRYKLKIYHEGFYSFNTPVVYISEGEKKENYNFVVTAKPPEVKVYSYRYTFAPGNRISFSLRTFRLESVKATVYRVPIETFLRGRSNPDLVDPAQEGFKTAVQWEESIKDFKPYQWRYQTLDIKDPLATGGYCIEVKGAGRVINRKYFTVTSVGLVVKRSQYSLLAYVSSLVKSKPLKDAGVVVFDSTPKQKRYRYSRYTYKAPQRIEDLPLNIVKTGRTDRDGLFKLRLSSDKHMSVLVIGRDGSYAISSTGSPAAFKREKYKYFVYTDRPVYRSGDRIYYKIIAKKRDRRFVPRPWARYYYKIINNDTRKTVKEGRGNLDEWGTAAGEVTVDAVSGLGTYYIRVGPAPKNLYGAGKFYVEQYRKPQFKIEITPSRDYFVNGDTIEFKVEAKYFFGAPLKNAYVKYRFYETRLRDTDTVYWWEEESGPARSYNKLKLEGEKYLDENGNTVLRLYSGNLPYDREITLEATVVDKSNVSISSSSKIRVGRGEYYIKINPLQNFFASNEKKSVEIKTLTHTGKPLSVKLKLSLYRYIWKPYQRVYVHERRPYFSGRIETDNSGRALVKLPENFSSYGEFDIVVQGADRRNNIITASRVVMIYNYRGGKIASRLKNLELSVNRTVLKRGGQITCLLKSRYPDSSILLTLEGRDIYKSQLVRMKGNIMPVRIKVKDSYAPNFYLTATMQRKRALFTRTVNISIPVSDTRLRIKINTDKDVYAPGEKAVVRIKTVDDNGNPLKADLSIAAVDESIYYIRRDHTPPMIDFFYTQISNWVLTGYSYPITILAGAAKEGKVKVRENFKDTAFWKASIRTDSSGEAKVNILLPDNLTTWRLTARAHDKKGRVGEKKKKFLVTQELIARIGRPRFFIEGDRVGIIGIVNSNTKRGLKEVKVDLQVNGKSVKPDKKRDISLPGFGSAGNFYSIDVPEQAKKLVLRFKARADSKARDALKITVPVLRRGSAFKLFGYGDMGRNRRVVISPVKESEDFKFVPESLTVSLNPSPIFQMLRAAKFLVQYPYGCVEQTINRFIPLLAVHRLLQNENFAYLINNKSVKDLPNMVKTGINRVERAQNYDGTWGWWAGDRGNEYLTGYALYSLFLADKFGYNVNDRIINRGLKAVGRMLKYSNVSNMDAKAFLLYIYSLWGRWDNRAFTEIIKLKKQNPYRLACLLKALSLFDPKKRYGKINVREIKEKIEPAIYSITDRLIKLQKSDDKGVYWPDTGSQRWSWPGSRTEITAHVLWALVQSGNESALPARIVRSLSKRVLGSRWSSTKETATVILAMCEYMKKRKGQAGESAEIDFKMNGKSIAALKYDPKTMQKSYDLIKTVPLDGIVPGKEYEVVASGKAGKDAGFDLTISGTLYFKPSGFFSIFKSEDKGLAGLSKGLQLFRSFSGIRRVMDIHNNEYLVPERLSERKSIRVGDELLVRVRFKAEDNFEYLLLADYLPSGFEVIKKNAYGEYKPYIHAERWDNRMVFFFNKLQKGKIYEVAYIIRAELPGKFMARPARMECMYEPYIQGWSAPAVIEVQKK